jgi:signal transduction histidine kinase
LSSFIAAIHFAESLDEALRRRDLDSFDILLLDLDLPYARCRDVLVGIRRTYPSLRSVVIASQHDRSAGLRLIAQGTKEFVVNTGDEFDTCYEVIRHAVAREPTYEVLDQKQKSLQAIFDAVPVGMMLVDESMIVRRVNDALRQMVQKQYSQIIDTRPERALGLVGRNPHGKPAAQHHDSAAYVLTTTLEHVLCSGNAVQGVEIKPKIRAGDRQIQLWLAMSAAPAPVDGRRHVVVVFDDISARKRAEEKLTEAIELKSHFVSTVSHELRTPLTCTKEAVAAILEGAGGEITDGQREFLDIAKRNIDRLANLISDVLDFQRLEAGEMGLNLNENDITQAVADACNMMSSSAGKKRVTLSVQFEDGLPKFRFDNDKIVEVLTNLISNAIKFTPARGKICVIVRRKDQDLVISVSDTGVGIPKEALPRIFERFYRVNRPGKHTQGTGLGLSIVDKIVAMHGGRIEVESQVDRGTTFSVFLPLAPKITTETIPETTGCVHPDK